MITCVGLSFGFAGWLGYILCQKGMFLVWYFNPLCFQYGLHDYSCISVFLVLFLFLCTVSFPCVIQRSLSKVTSFLSILRAFV